MERVTRKEKLSLQFCRPTGFNKLKIKLFVRPINFIADDGVPEMREMHPNLMCPSGAGDGPDNREPARRVVWPNEPPHDPELRYRRRAAFVDHLLEPDARGGEFALARERSVDRRRLPFRPAKHDREIFLFDLAPFHRAAEPARARQIFRDQDESARFAIEPVHDRNLAAVHEFEREQLAQRRPERRRAVRFGRVNEKERRLVDHEVVIGFRDEAEFWRRPCARYGRR